MRVCRRLGSRKGGKVSGILCCMHSEPHLSKCEGRDSCLPCLYHAFCTVLTEKLASGLALSIDSTSKAQSDDSSNIDAWLLESSEESIESFHFEWIVFFQLLESDLVGIRDVSRVLDELSVGIHRHRLIIMGISWWINKSQQLDRDPNILKKTYFNNSFFMIFYFSQKRLSEMIKVNIWFVIST